METFQIEINWRGNTFIQKFNATSADHAKKAALMRYPGATLRRIVRVSSH